MLLAVVTRRVSTVVLSLWHLITCQYSVMVMLAANQVYFGTVISSEPSQVQSCKMNPACGCFLFLTTPEAAHV